MASVEDLTDDQNWK